MDLTSTRSYVLQGVCWLLVEVDILITGDTGKYSVLMKTGYTKDIWTEGEDEDSIENYVLRYAAYRIHMHARNM